MGIHFPDPKILSETKAYWDSANQGILLVKVCKDCDEAHFYPRDICPYCLSENTEWRQSSGIGHIYSFSVVEKELEHLILSYVTLQEGVTMMTNIVECSVDDLEIGAEVEVDFVKSESGQSVPVFKLK